MHSIRNIMRPNMPLGTFFVCLLLFVFITVSVSEALFRNYVFDPHFVMIGVPVHPLTYAFALAFVGYLLQRLLSRTFGSRRVIDLLVSSFMLVLIAVAFGVWMKLPVFNWLVLNITSLFGYQVDPNPNEYKLAIALIFGALAVIDFGRDFLGIGRRSSRAGSSLDSDTRILRRRTIIEDEFLYKHPVTGALIPMTNPPQSLIDEAQRGGGPTTTVTTGPPTTS